MEDSAPVQNLDSQEGKETFQEEREEVTQAMTQWQVSKAMTMTRMLPHWPRPTLWQKSAPILGEWRIGLTWTILFKKALFLVIIQTKNFQSTKGLWSLRYGGGHGGGYGSSHGGGYSGGHGKGTGTGTACIVKVNFCSQELFLHRSRTIHIYQARNQKVFAVSCLKMPLFVFLVILCS